MASRFRHIAPVVVAVSLATAAALLPASSRLVLAASCNGSSHPDPVLSGGGATPGSGGPSTAIEFSVHYADSVGCAPSSIDVVISGVGRFGMTASGSGFKAGVTFTASRRLPVGSWSYHFEATSGSGAGHRMVSKTSVSPSKVVIEAATPKPSPKPKPTAKPTPRPTPRPTARPTPRPTKAPQPTSKPRQSPSPAPHGGSTTTPRPSPVPTGTTNGPSHGAGPGPSAAPAFIHPPGTAGRGGAGDGVSPGGSSPTVGGLPWVGTLDAHVTFPILVWSLTTAFGVVAFAFYLRPVARRRHPLREQPDRRVAPVATAPEPLGIGASVAATVVTAPTTAPLPPWLRRRDGSDGPDASRTEAVRFHEPPKAGASRYTISYRWVRVSDGPDEPSSNEIGRLDRGDEVEVIGEKDGALLIRTPSGLEGWVPRFVIVG